MAFRMQLNIKMTHTIGLGKFFSAKISCFYFNFLVCFNCGVLVVVPATGPNWSYRTACVCIHVHKFVLPNYLIVLSTNTTKLLRFFKSLLPNISGKIVSLVHVLPH